MILPPILQLLLIVLDLWENEAKGTPTKRLDAGHRKNTKDLCRVSLWKSRTVDPRQELEDG
jgi:hypothetical protein